MDEFFKKVFSQNGWLGLLSAILLLEKASIVWGRFRGTYISRKAISLSVEETAQDLTRIRDHIDQLRGKVEAQLEKAREDDIRMAKIELTIEHLKEIVIELKESRDKGFSMIADIKTLLIEQALKRK